MKGVGIYQAVASGDIQKAMSLLSKKIKVREVELGRALVLAASRGYVKVVAKLLRTGVNPDYIDRSYITRREVELGLFESTALMAICKSSIKGSEYEKNLVKILSLLAEFGADLKQVDSKGRPAIHWALRCASFGFVKAFVSMEDCKCLRDEKTGLTTKELAIDCGLKALPYKEAILPPIETVCVEKRNRPIIKNLGSENLAILSMFLAASSLTSKAVDIFLRMTLEVSGKSELAPSGTFEQRYNLVKGMNCQRMGRSLLNQNPKIVKIG